jgi:hypothetical protein
MTTHVLVGDGLVGGSLVRVVRGLQRSERLLAGLGDGLELLDVAMALLDFDLRAAKVAANVGELDLELLLASKRGSTAAASCAASATLVDGKLLLFCVELLGEVLGARGQVRDARARGGKLLAQSRCLRSGLLDARVELARLDLAAHRHLAEGLRLLRELLAKVLCLLLQTLDARSETALRLAADALELVLHDLDVAQQLREAGLLRDERLVLIEQALLRAGVQLLLGAQVGRLVAQALGDGLGLE